MGLLYQFSPAFLAFVIAASIWELVWKGLGLWKAATLREKGWFIAILIFNTLGLLPIIYLGLRKGE